MQNLLNLNYRPDIDGLRAIAVLSVILFHINKSLIPGGFVGVDMFFVISGFLISRRIIRDLDKGSFSILDFYCRRVKRIIPPMLLVVTVTFITAQLLLIPEDSKSTAISALWSLLSLSNVYFWLYQDTSYFAPDSNETPLLHLWSLGVEEQFYIFWPLFLLFTYHLQKLSLFLIVTTLVTLASFLFAELIFELDASFAYYMLPTRAGELLLGALVAFAILRKVDNKVPKMLILPMAMLGFFLILFSIFFISEEKIFPGFLAVPPTFGTALLIFTGHGNNNLLSHFLAIKPLVWVGLISYSAYLWHWPLLAFYRYGYGEVNVLVGIVVFVLTLLLSWISYLYVEQPARSSNLGTGKIFLRQYIVPASVIALLALGAIYIEGYGFRLLSPNYKIRSEIINEQTLPAYKYHYVCQTQKVTLKHIEGKDCVVGFESEHYPKAILWGDSNAAHYVGMVGAFAQKGGFSFRNIAIGECPPINSDAKKFVPAKRWPICRDSAEIMWQTVNSFQVVIISSSWTTYQGRSNDFFDTFFDTVLELTKENKLVILIGKAPIISGHDRLCKVKALSYPFLNCSSTNTPPLEHVMRVNEILQKFATENVNVEYFGVTPYLCPNSVCSAFNLEGKSLYYDNRHLSLPGSWEIGYDIIERDGVPFPFTLISNWSDAKIHKANLKAN